MTWPWCCILFLAPPILCNALCVRWKATVTPFITSCVSGMLACPVWEGFCSVILLSLWIVWISFCSADLQRMTAFTARELASELLVVLLCRAFWTVCRCLLRHKTVMTLVIIIVGRWKGNQIPSSSPESSSSINGMLFCIFFGSFMRFLAMFELFVFLPTADALRLFAGKLSLSFAVPLTRSLTRRPSIRWLSSWTWSCSLLCPASDRSYACCQKETLSKNLSVATIWPKSLVFLMKCRICKMYSKMYSQ